MIKGDQRQLGGHEDRLKDQVWNCLITSLDFVLCIFLHASKSLILFLEQVWIRLVIRT